MMAYRTFAEPHDTAFAVPAAAPIADRVPARLSPIEWAVVALARTEKLGSINRPGRIALAMHRLFGLKPANELADARLEALRRLAVVAWHRGEAVDPAMLEACRAAGFTRSQIELALASIARGRRR